MANLERKNEFTHHSGCAVCYSTGGAEGKPLMMCSRCKNVHYCSKRHQKKHWKTHKKNCKKKKQVVKEQKDQAGEFEITRLMNRAFRKMNELKLDEAIENLEEARQIADAMFFRNDETGGIILHYSHRFAVRLQLIRLYLKVKRLEEARVEIEYLESIVSCFESPEYQITEIYALKATYLDITDHKEDAQKLYEKIIDILAKFINEDCVPPYVRRSLVISKIIDRLLDLRWMYQFLGKFDEKLTSCRRIVKYSKLCRTDVGALELAQYYLADCLANDHRDYKNAVKYLEKAITGAKNHGLYRTELICHVDAALAYPKLLNSHCLCNQTEWDKVESLKGHLVAAKNIVESKKDVMDERAAHNVVAQEELLGSLRKVADALRPVICECSKFCVGPLCGEECVEMLRELRKLNEERNFMSN